MTCYKPVFTASKYACFFMQKNFHKNANRPTAESIHTKMIFEVLKLQKNQNVTRNMAEYINGPVDASC